MSIKSFLTGISILPILLAFSIPSPATAQTEPSPISPNENLTIHTDKPEIKQKVYPSNPNQENPSDFRFSLRPGESATEKITLENQGSEPHTFYLYTVDSYQQQDDKLYFRLEEYQMSEVGSWTSLSQGPEITVQPYQTQEIDLNISIPPETPLGNYRGGLAIEKKAQATTESGIRINTRSIANIKVEVTDNPQTIEKMPSNSNSQQYNFSWTHLYLAFSIILFIAMIAFFLAPYFRKSKSAGNPSQRNKK